MPRITKRLRRTILSIIGACIVASFLYHMIEGDRGWFAMLRLQQQVRDAQASLSQVQKDRQELEHRTQLMRPNSLDPDLLDEKSRELLNYSKPNEIVVLTPPENGAAQNNTSSQNILQRNK